MKLNNKWMSFAMIVAQVSLYSPGMVSHMPSEYQAPHVHKSESLEVMVPQREGGKCSGKFWYCVGGTLACSCVIGAVVAVLIKINQSTNNVTTTTYVMNASPAMSIAEAMVDLDNNVTSISDNTSFII